MNKKEKLVEARLGKILEDHEKKAKLKLSNFKTPSGLDPKCLRVFNNNIFRASTSIIGDGSLVNQTVTAADCAKSFMEYVDYLPRNRAGVVEPVTVYLINNQNPSGNTIVLSAIFYSYMRDVEHLVIGIPGGYMVILDGYDVAVMGRTVTGFKLVAGFVISKITDSKILTMFNVAVNAMRIFKEIYDHDLNKETFIKDSIGNSKISIGKNETRTSRVIDIRKSTIVVKSAVQHEHGREVIPHDRRAHVRTYRNPDGSIKKQVKIAKIKVKGGNEVSGRTQVYRYI